MQFNEQWLREWVNPAIDTEQLAEQLTTLGLEVDAYSSASGAFTHVVVGEVLAAEPHPDAKRLRCTQVRVGSDTILPIVCAGKNVRVGLKVAVATVGAQLPSDFTISSTTLRGQPSEGMICSGKELGMGEGLDPDGGIMELALNAPVGMPLQDYLRLPDVTFDIELTPNRGDCASIRGIAREVAVKNGLPFVPIEVQPQLSTIDDLPTLSLQAEAMCPRYAARIIRGVDLARAMTPMWLQQRLIYAGMRCVNPVVDVMNYVMLEWGQPMHAFDLQQLTGTVQIRMAAKGESIKLLDEQAVSLLSEHLIIADDDKPLALAGVMGGLSSAVTLATKDVLLESAYFDAINIRKTAKHFSIQSDASYRFERGVDPTIQELALERATELLLTIVGGQAGPVVCEQCLAYMPDVPPILLRYARIEKILGYPVVRERITTLLSALGMQLLEQGADWQVTVPSSRFDVTQEIDLIEEIARLVGYDNIPERPARGASQMVNLPNTQVTLNTFADYWVQQGYSEIISFSFIDKKDHELFQLQPAPLALLNPLSNDLAAMQVSLLPGLLSTWRYNQNRQGERIRLFEIGRCFIPQSDQSVHQPIHLGLLAAGDYQAKQWGASTRQVDFFDVKRDVEQYLSTFLQRSDFSWQSADHPMLHPGQTAALIAGDQQIGVLGALHPRLSDEYGLTQAVILAEFDVKLLLLKSNVSFCNYSRFPSIKRDMAIVVEQSIAVQALVDLIRETAGDVLHEVEILDIYQGESIAVGEKSVALGLTFQALSRTLRETEINELFQSLVDTLQDRFNAKLRA